MNKNIIPWMVLVVTLGNPMLPAAELPTSDGSTSGVDSGGTRVVERGDTIRSNHSDSASEVQAMAARIDQLIGARLTDARLQPAPMADDESFIRRAYLDLIGRNPDPIQIVAYAQDKSTDKRRDLLVQLVQSQGISSRLADVWSDLLLPENNDNDPGGIGRDSLRRWLQRKFSENQRYDRIVSDLLIAKGSSADQPTAFFAALELKPEKLAEKTSRAFLGVTLDCAQCHDHPFAPWKQTDFWSLAAYFAQLKSSEDRTAMRGSSSISDVETGEVTLPATDTIIPPKSLVSGIESQIVNGSRRQQLVIWLTSRENKWFARAAVNRFWALMMGRGLVEPVDDMGPQSIASHPELLDSLADYFVSVQFDVRHLLLAIALTDAYARDSVHPSGAVDPKLYATLSLKPLTSRQLGNCLRQAARQSTPAAGTMDAWTLLAQQLGKVRGDGLEYTGGVLQALVTQHGTSMEAVWSDSQSKLLTALSAPHLGPQEQVRWMFLATLGRSPSVGELQNLSVSMPNDLSNETAAQNWRADLLWALVNSTEFAMTP